MAENPATKKKTLKIALFDVRHRTLGLHAYQMPLAIGDIGAYANEYVQNARVELRLYVDAHKFLAEFRDFKPDIVGASFYTWNRALTLHLMKAVKESFPGTLTVLGGPEIEMEADLRREFLEEHRQIDVCVWGEGEETFREIAELWADGVSVRGRDNCLGTFYFKEDGKTFVDSEMRPKLSSLDVVPSPYLTGLFDQFFEEKLHPFLETTRGCPFSCSFCREALPMHNKIRHQSRSRFADELEYCAKKVGGVHNIQLCLADSNFGMYKWNVEAAQDIRRIQDQYNWPRYVSCSTGKNLKERIIGVSQILKWGLFFTMSVQSLNAETLKAIKRDNISIEAMEEVLKGSRNESNDTYSELILSMPMETPKSFESGIQRCIELDLNRIIIMTLVMLKGTPLADRSSRRQYEMETKYRIIPRQFGRYEGQLIVETEEVVVSTSTMREKDYLYLRELQYVLHVVYNSDNFNLIRRFLNENDIPVWDWLLGCYKLAKTLQDEAGRQMRLFCDENRDELFLSRDAAHEFADGNYDRLLSSERGDNLMNKYGLMANVTGFDAWLGAALRVAHDLAVERGLSERFVREALADIRTFIKLRYDFSKFFDDLPKPNERRRMNFNYDIELWVKQRDATLDSLREKIVYEYWYSADQIGQMNAALNSGSNKLLNLQFIYRDRKFDNFLPIVARLQDAGYVPSGLPETGSGEPLRDRLPC